MNLIETITGHARAQRARVGIGIGVGDVSESVQRDIESACEFADVVLIRDSEGSRATEIETDLEIIYSESPEEELVRMLMDREIDACVRGTLSATKTLAYLRSALGVARLRRLSLLTTANRTPFFLAPVGIDEGNTARDKIDLACEGASYIARFGVRAKVAVISGGRFEDRGRSEIVDQSLADGEIVAERLRALGIDAEHYGILIEDAVGDANFILAPDGITGNLIFRTLTFLGGGGGFGAPVLTDEVVFVDTSRVKTKYSDAIMLASALVGNVDR
jgi:putative methanogen marker protein 4